MRDSLGRFLNGRVESLVDKLKRIESYKKSVKNSDWYTGDIKIENTYIYNSWRSIMYTKKGKLAGISEEWRFFKMFYNDVSLSYNTGNRLCRIDKSKIFSIDNFVWLSDNEKSILNGNSIVIELDGESKTIKEWSAISGRSYNSIKNRYYKHKDLSNKEIIYGTLSKPKRDTKDRSECENIRIKVSKMCSSYRIKDLKKGLKYNLDIDWFINNIVYNKCIYCGDDKNIGCDRIDNSIGHIKSNVVPCCYTCNVVRNNIFSVEEMKILGSVISKIKKKRIDDTI